MLNLKVKESSEVCEPCILGKSHKLSFKLREPCTVAGELVSTDIFGPFPLSFRKLRYFILFKDHYTKFQYVFFLKQKSDAFEALRSFLAYAKNLRHSVKQLLSDNGGEFANERFFSLFKENGIIHRLTAPFTPEQN